MVCKGLMRPSAGYLLLAPCGPWLSKLSASEITLPLRTRRAAATMSCAVVWFSVPISSFGPQRPQFLYFSAALRRSSRVSLRWLMVWRSARGKRIAYQAAALGGAVLVAWFLISNTMTNLEERRIGYLPAGPVRRADQPAGGRGHRRGARPRPRPHRRPRPPVAQFPVEK